MLQGVLQLLDCCCQEYYSSHVFELKKYRVGRPVPIEMATIRHPEIKSPIFLGLQY